MINVRSREDLERQLPLHKKWLAGEEGGERLVCAYGVDLSAANLSGADLRRAILSGVDLSGANLSDADLRGVNLRRADLSGANLSGADLSGADLRRVNLRRAVLPSYQKWSVTWKINGIINIGCKAKTVAEWDEWFASSNIYETRRGTADFERIEAAYQHAKRMYEIWLEYESKSD